MELSVSCKRLDRIRIPFIGVLTKHLLGVELRAPKIHVATVRYGMEKDGIISDRWTYRGVDLYAAYDTEQIFQDNYPHGLYSYLSPWHVKGRHEKIRMKPSEWVKAVIKDDFPRPYVPPKSKHRIAALLANLPPDERLKHFKRLEQAGAFA